MPMLTVEKLNNVVNEFDLNGDEFTTFIETGTYMGDTIKSIQPYFEACHTIEISELLYQKFLRDHPVYENVEIHLGDSSEVVPTLLNQFDENKKCVFWLDGHFSSGCTSKGEKDVPLLEECKGIDSLYKADEALVLIDDLRLFETDHAEDWSEISIENILNCFTNFEVKQYEHPDDMFCLYIKRKK